MVRNHAYLTANATLEQCHLQSTGAWLYVGICYLTGFVIVLHAIFRGYSEVQVVHEVLKRNRGYLELKIPIDAIITQLHAQNILLDYEYAEMTSQPFPIKKNRLLIDALLEKHPSTFYQFCSILEGQHGYEYIAHHLLREVRDLDPNIPLEDKVSCMGGWWCGHSSGVFHTMLISLGIPVQ